MPDREVSAQRGQRPLVEDLGHQPHVLVDEDRAPVGGRDAGRLLPAVLQRVEAVVGELGDLLAGSPDAEDPAGVLRALLAGKEVVRQLSVAACHVRSVSHRAEASVAAFQQDGEDGGDAAPSTQAPRTPEEEHRRLVAVAAAVLRRRLLPPK